MGKKLENAYSLSKEGTDRYYESRKLGGKAASEVKTVRAMIDSLPTDVDDEIKENYKALLDRTKLDAEGYMLNDVGARVEAGKNNIEMSTREAREQIKNNEMTQAILAKIDSISDFGKLARMEGFSRAGQSTKEFNKIIYNNERETKVTEAEFRKNLSDISGTF